MFKMENSIVHTCQLLVSRAQTERSSDRHNASFAGVASGQVLTGLGPRANLFLARFFLALQTKDRSTERRSRAQVLAGMSGFQAANACHLRIKSASNP